MTLQEESNNESKQTDSKISKIINYMKTTIVEMFGTLRHPEFRFAISGAIVSAVLVILGIGLFLVDIDLVGVIVFPKNPIGIVVSFVVGLSIIYLWFLLGLQIAPKIAHILVDNKWVRKIFAKGDIAYIEYVPVEKRKIALSHILSKFISVIITWVSIAALLITMIDPNPLNFLTDNDLVISILRFVIIFVVVPLLFTLIYPVGWMLSDAKLKSFNSGTKLNLLVGKKFSSLTSGFFTVGSIIAVGANVATDIGTRLQLVVGLVVFCLVNLTLTAALIVVFYNVFFQGKFYQIIISSLDIGFGITKVIPVDKEGNILPDTVEVQLPKKCKKLPTDQY